jgi:hypothetical protein
VAYVGHWLGEGHSDADYHQQFTIALDLRPGKREIGSIIGSVRYEGSSHAGAFAQYSLRFIGLTNGGIQVWEEGGFADVVLQLDSGTITYQARNSGDPVYWVTAFMSRIS